ncbi:MAG: DUF4189 domain-containing protein [Rhizobiaceae bacterium]|nr:DUF4189 domain-containing protein [Rhizobiaceae bacterium]
MQKRFQTLTNIVVACGLLSAFPGAAAFSPIVATAAYADDCNLSVAMGPVGPNGELHANDTIFCDVTPSSRYTAVAISDTTLAWGTAWAAPSKEEAERVALAECLTQAKDCHTQTWATGCVALAESPADGTWGADYDLFVDFAESKALARCSNAGGSDCRIVAHPCSGD